MIPRNAFAPRGVQFNWDVFVGPGPRRKTQHTRQTKSPRAVRIPRFCLVFFWPDSANGVCSLVPASVALHASDEIRQTAAAAGRVRTADCGLGRDEACCRTMSAYPSPQLLLSQRKLQGNTSAAQLGYTAGDPSHPRVPDSSARSLLPPSALRHWWHSLSLLHLDLHLYCSGCPVAACERGTC